MILIQILLIIALTLIGVSFIRSRRSNRTKAYKKILLLFFVPVAVVFVLFPDLSTSIANSVGVGRGADLLLYGVTVVLIFTLFNNYLKANFTGSVWACTNLDSSDFIHLIGSSCLLRFWVGTNDSWHLHLFLVVARLAF
jgi:hypothetical protein